MDKILLVCNWVGHCLIFSKNAKPAILITPHVTDVFGEDLTAFEPYEAHQFKISDSKLIVKTDEVCQRMLNLTIPLRI